MKQTQFRHTSKFWSKYISLKMFENLKFFLTKQAVRCFLLFVITFLKFCNWNFQKTATYASNLKCFKSDGSNLNPQCKGIFDSNLDLLYFRHVLSSASLNVPWNVPFLCIHIPSCSFVFTKQHFDGAFTQRLFSCAYQIICRTYHIAPKDALNQNCYLFL